MEHNDLLYWVWLSLACETGSSKTDRLCETFSNDPRAVYEADRDTYEDLGFKGDILNALCRKETDRAQSVLEHCEKKQYRILTPADAAYPDSLRRMMARPIVLYVRGDLPSPDTHLCVAMVGTRRMTAYGKYQAYQIAFDLAKQGACVVSGMAKGIDGISHRGCLDAGGKTVAVLGCGLDVCYPPEHKALMEEIARNGAVLSEYCPSRRPDPGTFPARNRIVSALSRGTLVVEAGEKSGALITAKRALSQGKDLYALPGNVGEQNSVGTNELIRQGAVSVTCAANVLLPYQPLFSAGVLKRIPCVPHKTAWEQKEGTAQMPRTPERKHPAHENGTPAMLSEQGAGIRNRASFSDDAVPQENTVAAESKPQTALLSSLSATERAVYAKIPAGKAVSGDELIDRSLSLVDVMTACTMLEIKGLIEGVPGGMYRRKE